MTNILVFHAKLLFEDSTKLYITNETGILLPHSFKDQLSLSDTPHTLRYCSPELTQRLLAENERNRILQFEEWQDATKGLPSGVLLYSFAQPSSVNQVAQRDCARLPTVGKLVATYELTEDQYLPIKAEFEANKKTYEQRVTALWEEDREAIEQETKRIRDQTKRNIAQLSKPSLDTLLLKQISEIKKST